MIFRILTAMHILFGKENHQLHIFFGIVQTNRIWILQKIGTIFAFTSKNKSSNKIGNPVIDNCLTDRDIYFERIDSTVRLKRTVDFYQKCAWVSYCTISMIPPMFPSSVFFRVWCNNCTKEDLLAKSSETDLQNVSCLSKSL